MAGESLIRQGPGIQTQIGAKTVGTGVATEGDGIESLARETGIPNAIEPFDARAVEGHR